MTVRVAINGLGRIGREVLRCVSTRDGVRFQVVAVNDLAGPRTDLVVRGQPVRTSAEPEPSRLPWRTLGVDIVVEATGRFRSRPAAAAHLAAGARKVLLTAPGRGVDATIVLGVNDEDYDPVSQQVVSNASATVNCAAPVLHVLHRAFGVRYGLLTAVRGHRDDPTDDPADDPTGYPTGAVGDARATGEVIPGLLGRLDGVAVPIPVEDAALIDVTVELDEPATVGQVNRAFTDAAGGYLKHILRCAEEPLACRDIIGEPASCVVDAGLTRARHRLIKVFGWHDNEWGFANRTVDLLEKMAASL